MGVAKLNSNQKRRIRRLAKKGEFISRIAREVQGDYHGVRNCIIDDILLYDDWQKARFADGRKERKPTTKKPLPVYPEIDRLALRENPPSLREMAGIVEKLKTLNSVRNYLLRRGLHFSWKEKRFDLRIYPEIDRLATQENPLSLEEMAEIGGGPSTKQGVKYYLVKRDIFERWRKNRRVNNPCYFKG